MELERRLRFQFKRGADLRYSIRDTTGEAEWEATAKADGSTGDDYILICRVRDSAAGGEAIWDGGGGKALDGSGAVEWDFGYIAGGMGGTEFAGGVSGESYWEYAGAAIGGGYVCLEGGWGETNEVGHVTREALLV